MTSGTASDGTASAGTPALKVSRVVVWTGVAVLVLAIGYGWVGALYGVGSRRAPGAGLFPVLVSLLVGAAGVFMVVSSLRGGTPAEDMAGADEAQSGEGSTDDVEGDQTRGSRTVYSPRVRIATVLGTLIAYVVAVTWIGHLITTVVVATIAVRLLGGRPWWQAGSFSVAIALGTQLLFGSLLGLPLPLGLYGPRL